MKRFYNNTKMSRAFNSALRVVALLCVLLGVSSSAWSESGFFQDKALSIKINDTWYDFNKDGHSGTNQLGNYLPGTGPNLQEFYYRTWHGSGDNVCSDGSGIFVKINDGNEQTWGTTTGTSKAAWVTDDNTNNEWTGTANNSIFTLTVPGTYGIKLKVKAKAGTSCNGTIELSNKNNHSEDPNYGSYYYFSYNVVKTIYLNGDGAIGRYDWSQAQAAEPTDDKDVVRFKLAAIDKNFDFSDSKSQNWTFFRSAAYDNSKDEGANISKIMNGNELNNLQAQISQANRDAGYSSPVYFYYNTSTKKYWVKASQKATYKIVFEDGTELGCTDLNKGDVCTNSIDLGEGTYRFKVYKNNVAYYYNANNSTFTNTLSNTALTQGDQYTTLVVDKYGTCTFTMQESNSNFNLTVGYTKLEEPVLIGAKAILSANQKEATLYAYLQGSLCTNQSITEYGFVLCSGGKDCVPTLSSLKLTPASTPALTRGDSYFYVAGIDQNHLIGGVNYGYRAYVTIAGTTYLSRETGYFTLQDDCTQQTAGGDPVVFTIDAALGADYENDCKLTYGSLQTAINKLKDSRNNESDYQYVTYYTQDGHESYDLRQPVIFNVRYYDDTPDDQSKAFCYQGNKKAEVSGGGFDSENSLALIFKDINRYNENDYTLTIQGASGTNRPWVHHIILRNSRNIVLDNLAIFSDPTGEKQDDALEFDINTTGWNTIDVGSCADANIMVKNCMIGSNGFTGLHASGYDGITFENNEFEAIMSTVGDTDNAVDWGASAKFMACKNIKFIRNNFRGAHATLIWLQDTQNALFMNNVFWNTNQYPASCSAVKLVEQYEKGPTKNIGFYYNTFYLADGQIGEDHSYDFLHTSDKGGGEEGKFSYITFQYNNCYSYDEDAPGKAESEPDGLSNSTICPNNYWSVNDDADFSFGNCVDSEVVPMDGLICETSATGPASLVIRGGGHLNKGPIITASEILTATGITITDDDELTYDRYNANARPDEVDIENYNGWTYGAYQGKEGVPVETIYWIGLSENWDDRNNWVYFTDNSTSQSKSGVQERGVVMQRLSCINKLSTNLKVIIPEKPLVQGSGQFYWPQIPAEFDEDERETINGIPAAEQVTAGLGYTNELTQFANTIEIEYGAAIKGVENLKTDRYTTAMTSIEIPRSKWVLVGTVVQPVIDGDRSNLRSRNFYLEKEPQVYMHYVEQVDAEGNATWSKTFTSLEEELIPTSIYAVNIPDEYGQAKLEAKYHYKYVNVNASMLNDGSVSKSFAFSGKFVNDAQMPEYAITKGQYCMLSNTYPCNLSAAAIEDEIRGSQVLYYDYNDGSFKSFDPSGDDVQIKVQQGFLYKHDTNTQLNINANMLADGNTRSRSIAQPLPVASINLHNANALKGASNIIIRYDAQQEAGMPAITDAEKVFAPNDSTPELYMMAYDKKWVRMNVASATQTIPLGIRLRVAMNVRFEKETFKGFDKVILVDALRELQHDLMLAPFTTEMLEPGDIEGRYYLNLVPSDNTEYEEDEDMTTAVEGAGADAAINIYTLQYGAVRIITNNVELESIHVSDMTGRTMHYAASGNATTLHLPVTQGVYLVHVVGDKATRTEKVVIK